MYCSITVLLLPVTLHDLCIFSSNLMAFLVCVFFVFFNLSLLEHLDNRLQLRISEQANNCTCREMSINVHCPYKIKKLMKGKILYAHEFNILYYYYCMAAPVKQFNYFLFSFFLFNLIAEGDNKFLKKSHIQPGCNLTSQFKVLKYFDCIISDLTIETQVQNQYRQIFKWLLHLAGV